jgi:hypothetical protein
VKSGLPDCTAPHPNSYVTFSRIPCTVPLLQKKQRSTLWPVKLESYHTGRYSVYFPVPAWTCRSEKQIQFITEENLFALISVPFSFLCCQYRLRVLATKINIRRTDLFMLFCCFLSMKITYDIVIIAISFIVALLPWVIPYELTPLFPDGVECTHLT